MSDRRQHGTGADGLALASRELHGDGGRTGHGEVTQGVRPGDDRGTQKIHRKEKGRGETPGNSGNTGKTNRTGRGEGRQRLERGEEAAGAGNSDPSLAKGTREALGSPLGSHEEREGRDPSCRLRARGEKRGRKRGK